MTTVDYCPRPKAEGNSPSGHPRHRGAMVLTIHQNSHEITVLLPINIQDTMNIKFVLLSISVQNQIGILAKIHWC